MQTPSHFLMTAVLGRQLTERQLPVHTRGLLIGSILPDLPFAVLTLAGEIYYRWFAVLPSKDTIMEYLHLTLFFTDPVWIISHNFFHSLLINAIIIALGYYGWYKRRGWGKFTFWLAVSMIFHTIIDIFTHHSDGPLFLFPLNWSYRFASSISYWEPQYYGQFFMAGEYTLDMLLLSYLGLQWIHHQRQGEIS